MNEVTNESADSFYLKGAASSYPTALVDPDGNERACVYLRNSAWNEMQILRQQLRRRDLSEAARQAVVKAIHEVVERNAAAWSRIGDESAADLDRVQPLVDRMKAEARGNAESARRQAVLAGRAEEQLRDYREYLRSVSALLAAPESTEQLIPRRAMGALNSIHQLQNYAVALAPGGLALAANGSLDWQRSFRRVNYFAYFTGVQVRNVPQASVGARPVDFVVARVPREKLVRILPPELAPDDDGVWLYKDRQSQALLLRRGDRIRYLPVNDLEESPEGTLRFSIVPAQPGLPLSLFEDLGAEWLGQWRSQREWMRAAPRCAYSTAVIGLLAEMAQPAAPPDVQPWSEFQWNERRSTAADLLLLASNHWNFNVRGFNPGGNHGSFFPVSSHATLLFAGGSRTGIPRGLKITEPYDGLSFAPTVKRMLDVGSWMLDGSRSGPVIEELFK